MPVARMTAYNRKRPSQAEIDTAQRAYDEVKGMSHDGRASIIGGIVLMRRSEGLALETLEHQVLRYHERIAELERDFVYYSLGIPNEKLMEILRSI